ncbi:putative uncharacterized protein DDB_G0291608 [Eriocheir sinensis]|uniref:putative uncharacterized protein DDB_G0291608 n=1 Tax=Eriocheir sinensis TaxID=95602 RepID=UPI0021C883EC|nr:putative uncharacterized protein DDB_G0291608 [Eriocheir sinensis]
MMEQDQHWQRGRHSSWSSDGRDGGGGHSPRRMHHSGSPSHRFKPNKPVWDDTVQDLASMRLTPAELARKLASRQSTNMALARAQLLDQSRRSGPQSLFLPPVLAARLQARQQSVDSILAQSNSTLLASQKVRQTEATVRLEEEEPAHESRTAAVESALVDQNQKSQLNPDHEERGGVTTNDSNFTINVKAGNENDKGKALDLPAKGACNLDQYKATSRTDTCRNIAERRQTELRTARETSRPIDRSQIAATRTSLDHTITMVVNTCRELWLQLEEERLTREHLQQQLQQQGNVITTLTAELLQIQEQQEAILQEVSDARASGLWGAGEVELGGDGRADMLGSHIPSGKLHGLRSSPHQTSSRHPQRSILRATRTIHQPHQRQSPQSLGRTHQSNHPTLPSSHRPPHSPRPHQPSSRSHTHSLQMHRPSPPPEPPLSPRPDSASLASYKASVARQIRDALGNENSVPGARERNSSTSSLGYSTVPEEALQRDIGEQQSQNNIGAASEENLLAADPSFPERRERKKQ